jgi:hypothetical protein
VWLSETTLDESHLLALINSLPLLCALSLDFLRESYTDDIITGIDPKILKQLEYLHIWVVGDHTIDVIASHCLNLTNISLVEFQEVDHTLFTSQIINLLKKNTKITHVTLLHQVSLPVDLFIKISENCPNLVYFESMKHCTIVDETLSQFIHNKFNIDSVSFGTGLCDTFKYIQLNTNNRWLSFCFNLEYNISNEQLLTLCHFPTSVLKVQFGDHKTLNVDTIIQIIENNPKLTVFYVKNCDLIGDIEVKLIQKFITVCKKSVELKFVIKDSSCGEVVSTV